MSSQETVEASIVTNAIVRLIPWLVGSAATLFIAVVGGAWSICHKADTTLEALHTDIAGMKAQVDANTSRLNQAAGDRWTATNERMFSYLLGLGNPKMMVPSIDQILGIGTAPTPLAVGRP